MPTSTLHSTTVRLISTRRFVHKPPITEIYTLSLHDALPICLVGRDRVAAPDDSFDSDLIGHAAGVGKRDPRRESVKECGLRRCWCARREEREHKRPAQPNTHAHASHHAHGSMSVQADG